MFSFFKRKNSASVPEQVASPEQVVASVPESEGAPGLASSQVADLPPESTTPVDIVSGLTSAGANAPETPAVSEEPETTTPDRVEAVQPEVEPEAPRKMSWMARLKQGLSKPGSHWVVFLSVSKSMKTFLKSLKRRSSWPMPVLRQPTSY